MQFGIGLEYDAGRTIVSVYGELDALSVPAFAGALIGLAESGTRFVTIDLSQLGFCSVGGLRAMAELAARLHAVEGRVEVLAPTILMRMLDLSALNSLFVLGEPRPITGASDDLDSAIGRLPHSGRPRAGSPHRLATRA
jgi:anti-anti-sigma factor